MGAAELVEGDKAGEEDADGEEEERGDGMEEEGTEDEEEEEVEVEGKKWLNHYSSGQSILLVGDGDFSFSLALATAFRSGANLVATSLDTYEDLKAKYSKAESNIMELKRLETKILHGVDVTVMRLHTELKSRRFDRVIFNFPHAGFKGREDQLHLIKLHKKLVRSFLDNAVHMLRPYGEIHVSHKMGQPYDSWNLECLAAEVSLIMSEKVCFQKEDYPGYNPKRGSGSRCDQPFPLGPCCTFKFQIGDLKKHKKRNQNSAGPVSLIGNHNVLSQNLANNIAPFHLPPLGQAYFRPVVNTVHMLTTALQQCVVTQQPGVPLNLNGTVSALHINHQGTVQPLLRVPGPITNILPAPGSIRPSVVSPLGSDYSDHQLHSEHDLQRRTIIPGATGLICSSAFLDDHRREYVQPGRDNYSYFDYHLGLQREHERQRQAMMAGVAGLSCSPAFLDDRRGEHIQPGRDNNSYFDHQLCLQREHAALQRQGMVPGAVGLSCSSAFLDERRKEYVQQGRDNYSYFDHQLGLQREHAAMQRQGMMPGETGLICSSAFLEDRRRENFQKQVWQRCKTALWDLQ